MGAILLHDPDSRRALLFDTITETPLPAPAFIGADALEQGESFFAWLEAHGDERPEQDFLNALNRRERSDPRAYTRDGLLSALEDWHEQCSGDEGLNEYGWALQRWFVEGLRAGERPYVGNAQGRR